MKASNKGIKTKSKEFFNGDSDGKKATPEKEKKPDKENP